MVSAVPLVIALLKAAVPVAAVVADRIDPEIAKDARLPRIVVRQATGRQVYGLARSTGLKESRVTVLCGAKTFTAAERLAGLVKAALNDIQNAAVLDHSVTLFQEGEDGSTFDNEAEVCSRIVGYRAVIGEMKGIQNA